MTKHKTIEKVFAENRKAYHDYFIEDTYEAG
ncbi:MAG: SsrA-binding protein, partial [bacterium]|nr:SsrA-binding protein [bacterium]